MLINCGTCTITLHASKRISYFHQLTGENIIQDQAISHIYSGFNNSSSSGTAADIALISEDKAAALFLQ